MGSGSVYWGKLETAQFEIVYVVKSDKPVGDKTLSLFSSFPCQLNTIPFRLIKSLKNESCLAKEQVLFSLQT